MFSSEAMAGHAGETGLGILPHELFGAVVLLIGAVLFLIVLSALTLWLVFRIERRLRKPQ